VKGGATMSQPHTFVVVDPDGKRSAEAMGEVLRLSREYQTGFDPANREYQVTTQNPDFVEAVIALVRHNPDCVATHIEEILRIGPAGRMSDANGSRLSPDEFEAILEERTVAHES